MRLVLRCVRRLSSSCVTAGAGWNCGAARLCGLELAASSLELEVGAALGSSSTVGAGAATTSSADGSRRAGRRAERTMGATGAGADLGGATAAAAARRVVRVGAACAGAGSAAVGAGRPMGAAAASSSASVARVRRARTARGAAERTIGGAAERTGASKRVAGAAEVSLSAGATRAVGASDEEGTALKNGAGPAPCELIGTRRGLRIGEAGTLSAADGGGEFGLLRKGERVEEGVGCARTGGARFCLSV